MYHGKMPVSGLIFVVFLLLSMSLSGCTVTGGPLHAAAYDGKLKNVEQLLDQGAPVNQKGGCGLWDAGGDFDATPLLCAALNGHLQTVRLLIERGADVNSRGSLGKTPLTAAAFARHAGIARLLIEQGADLDYALNHLRKYRPDSDYPFLQTLAKSLAPPQPAEQRLATPQPLAPPQRPAVASDVDLVPAPVVRNNANAYALVIGIEQYRQQLPAADFATRDARTMRDYLTKFLGYPEENVVTLIDEQAALGDFIKYVEKWLPNNAAPAATVFIYYSGHGAPNPRTGDAYLVPYDGDPTFIEETGYPLQRLYAALGTLPAKEIVVVLDSCFSGAGDRSVIAQGARGLTLKLKDASLTSRNMTVFAASSGDQMSSTYHEKGHGLLTYYFLKGLKDTAVVAADGTLSLDDLFAYLRVQVEQVARKKYNNEQTPQLLKARE